NRTPELSLHCLCYWVELLTNRFESIIVIYHEYGNRPTAEHTHSGRTLRDQQQITPMKLKRRKLRIVHLDQYIIDRESATVPCDNELVLLQREQVSRRLRLRAIQTGRSAPPREVVNGLKLVPAYYKVRAIRLSYAFNWLCYNSGVFRKGVVQCVAHVQ